MARAARVALFACGFASLAFGIAAGLARAGLDLPLARAELAALHGPLVGGAFFGTVIGLERAVALGRAWVWLAPLGAAAGALAWILGAGRAAGGALLAAGGLVLLAASLELWRRHAELPNACLALGAACLPAGAALVAGGDSQSATPLWLGFLALTIAGERLELSRLLPRSRTALLAFAAIAAALFASSLVAAFAPAVGWPALCTTMLALALWLAIFDVARRTVREQGLARYIASALLAGYAWLAAGALIALGTAEFLPGRPAYDAALHAFFLGFAFSMVFGHAPIIAPALLRVSLPYAPVLYAPLALLHATVALRIVGDLAAFAPLRAAGASGNAAAIALFLVTMASRALARR
ncbi:MAG: hypothetical protein N2653_03660 [Burkholderiales bacterium]|nr:hypothetical protein [Burkholderiales bacterium]